MGNRWDGMIQVDLGAEAKARVQRIADANPAHRGNMSAAVRDLLSRGIRDHEAELVIRLGRPKGV